MEIQKISRDSINFKKIQLNKAEQKKAFDLLINLTKTDVSSKVDKIKFDIFELFDPHLQKEAFSTSAKFVFGKDFLQTLYLKFFELLEKVKEKELLPENFVEKLDNVKADEEDMRVQASSLDTPYYREGSKKNKIDFITEDNLPRYASQMNEEERKILQDKIYEIQKDTVLTETESQVFNFKKEGKTFKEIAEISGKSWFTTRNAFLSAIAKIQKQNDVLPEEYIQHAKFLKERYELDISLKKIVDILIKKSLIFLFLKNRDVEKTLGESSKILGLSEKDILMASFRNPQVLHQKPENMKRNFSEIAVTLNIPEEKLLKCAVKAPNLLLQNADTIKQNVLEASKVLNVTEEEFIKSALIIPSLFAMKSGTIKQNISKAAKSFNITEEKYIRAASHQPNLFVQKSETLKQNLSDLSDVTKIDETDLIKAGLRSPSLFSRNPDASKENILKIAEIFNISIKEAIKAALREPSLFYRSPETLRENFLKISEEFNIPPKALLRVGLRQPSVIVQKPETIIQNIKKSAELFNIKEEDFVKAALLSANLFYQKPETLKNNISKTAELLNISEETFIKVALKQPVLFYLKPEKIKQNISQIAKIFDIPEQEFFQMSLNSPSVFSLKPETAEEKMAIYNLHRKVTNHKRDKGIAFVRNGNDHLYKPIIAHYIKKELKGEFKVNLGNYMNAIRKYPNRIFHFDLPADKASEDCVQYIKEFFKKNFGTENCEFTIDGKAVK